MPAAGFHTATVYSTRQAMYVRRNIEARSRNYCCHGKQSVLHTLVCVCARARVRVRSRLGENMRMCVCVSVRVCVVCVCVCVCVGEWVGVCGCTTARVCLRACRHSYVSSMPRADAILSASFLAPRYFYVRSQNCEKRVFASSCPSVRIEQLGSLLMDFDET